MSQLIGKVAIVTGSSRGIGAAIAKRLAKDGAKVVVNYSRNSEAAEKVVAEIQGSGGEAMAIQADIADLSQLKNLFTQTIKHYQKLDILVNNAGVSDFRMLEEIDEAYYTKFFNINVRAPLFAMKYAAKSFGESGGTIVNITSGVVNDPMPGTCVYSGTKATLNVMTKALATELGSRQITVNSIAPGVVATDMLDEMIAPEWQQQIVNDTALGRLGMPEDIADVVAFLVSHDARWITGEIIGVNGGLR